jgi:hypothetical protein
MAIFNGPADTAMPKCISVPIDLKLCDETIRALGGEAEEEEAVHGKEVEESTEVA